MKIIFLIKNSHGQVELQSSKLFLNLIKIFFDFKPVQKNTILRAFEKVHYFEFSGHKTIFYVF